MGADVGALMGANQVGLDTGGTAPHGWWTGGRHNRELLERYGLKEGELDPKIYPKRSMKNVDDADGTLAILWKASIGTLKTIGYAQTKRWGYPIAFKPSSYKPYCVITTDCIIPAAAIAEEFIMRKGIKILNVAGHSENTCPGVQEFTRKLIILTYERIASGVNW